MSILAESMGESPWLAEKDFDAFTRGHRLGPGLRLLHHGGLIESAVNLGLPLPMATKMVEGLLTGSAKLAAESPLQRHPAARDGHLARGHDREGAHHLDRRAVRAALIDGVTASYDRSIELGNVRREKAPVARGRWGFLSSAQDAGPTSCGSGFLGRGLASSAAAGASAFLPTRFSHSFMSFIFLRRSRCKALHTSGIFFG